MLLEVKKHLREAAEREKQLKTVSHDSQVRAACGGCVKCLWGHLHCIVESLPFGSSLLYFLLPSSLPPPSSPSFSSRVLLPILSPDLKTNHKQEDGCTIMSYTFYIQNHDCFKLLICMRQWSLFPGHPNEILAEICSAQWVTYLSLSLTGRICEGLSYCCSTVIMPWCSLCCQLLFQSCTIL